MALSAHRKYRHTKIIVGPRIVTVWVGTDRIIRLGRTGFAKPAQHKQPSVPIDPQFAKRYARAPISARVERRTFATAFLPGMAAAIDASWAGIDHQLAPIVR